ncbi:Protein W02D3.4 [Aphelenchoides avenae]|nr:Protein W02D3.4 [Aphelenchus avenae]KAH7716450.1 Protein W02D3.4 [Aphelenchus avenae]
MFVPVKKFHPGDGMFAQWMMCLAILLVGFCCFIWEGTHQFFPLAMVGGALWCTGNLMAVPIMNELGMGLGILLWSVTNSITSWATGNFGLFGTTPRPAESKWMNYGGLILTLVGGALISFVKIKPAPVVSETESRKLSFEEYMKKYSAASSGIGSVSASEASETWDAETGMLMYKAYLKSVDCSEGCEEASKKSPMRRIIAIFFAFLSGIFYGVNPVPIIFMQDNPQLFGSGPNSMLPYVFSHYYGAFAASTTAFVVYALVKKNRPSINPSCALPCLVAGVFWGAAQTLFFLATENLSQSITGPISSTMPGCVASLWSLLYFREIETGRNLYLLFIAIATSVLGSSLIGLSK